MYRIVMHSNVIYIYAMQIHKACVEYFIICMHFSNLYMKLNNIFFYS